MRTILAICAASSSILPGVANAASACPRQRAEDIVNAMQSMFAAAATDDRAFRAALAPGFYAFENGIRMDGRQLPDLIAQQRSAGIVHRWSVTRPDVQIDCTLATIAYVNVGAVGSSSKMTTVTWLESATLRYRKGRWLVRFLNSVRSPPKH